MAFRPYEFRPGIPERHPFCHLRSYRPPFVQMPVWKSTRQSSISKEFADLMTARTIHSPSAGGPQDSNDFLRSKASPINLRPLGDRVVINRIDAEEKSAIGSIISDAAQARANLTA